MHKGFKSNGISLIPRIREHNLLQASGSYVIHIDEYEVERLSLLLEQFAIENAGTMVWDKGMPIAGTKGLATQHEYVLFLTKGNAPIRARKKNIDQIKEQAKNRVTAESCVWLRVEKGGVFRDELVSEQRPSSFERNATREEEYSEIWFRDSQQLG